jgi:hypothetical protein
LILILAIAAIFLFSWKKLERERRWLLFALMVFVTIPLGMLLAYAFPIYYWWMRYLPLSLVFSALVENSFLSAGVWVRRSSLAGVLLAVSIFGLPGRLLLAGLNLPERDYGRVDEFVRQSVHPHDVVVAGYEAFYPMQELHLIAYYPSYLSRISVEEAGSVNCLVIDPKLFDSVSQKVGGNWKYTGQEYSNKQKFGIRILDGLMPRYFQEQTNRKYHLAVYRRTSS